MSDPILARVQPIVGTDGVRRGPDGLLRVVPPRFDAVAGLLGLAHDEGWRVAVIGGGTWATDLPPADLVLSLRGLDEIRWDAAAPDILTVGAGVPLEAARRAALEQGAWVPLDPPGRPDRTMGSVLATATAGPLRHRHGGVREQVTALSVVSGDGRVAHSSAEADPELVRLHLGAFGGFGAIVGGSIRLAPLPRTDITWIATADRDRLTATARLLASHRVDAAAMELFSPALATDGDWVLAVRLVGSREAVRTEADRVVAVGELDWHELPPERHVLLWNSTARAITSAPVTLRLGVLPEGVDEAIDLVIARLGEAMLSAGPASGGLRWSGDAGADILRELRGALAAREIPLTLERAPATLARAVGILGAYREGGSGAVDPLRATHDPRHVFATPLELESHP